MILFNQRLVGGQLVTPDSNEECRVSICSGVVLPTFLHPGGFFCYSKSPHCQFDFWVVLLMP